MKQLGDAVFHTYKTQISPWLHREGCAPLCSAIPVMQNRTVSPTHHNPEPVPLNWLHTGPLNFTSAMVSQPDTIFSFLVVVLSIKLSKAEGWVWWILSFRATTSDYFHHLLIDVLIVWSIKCQETVKKFPKSKFACCSFCLITSSKTQRYSFDHQRGKW